MSVNTTDPSLYKLNHTMIRVKDPVQSIEFYRKHFGMFVQKELPFPDAKFTVYFLSSSHLTGHFTSRSGLLELTHNWGTEKLEKTPYVSGNVEPHRGFGHIAFTVPGLEEFCSKLESAGVKFQKKLTDGRQKNLAFALDPDGYWVEILEGPDKETRLNHSMLRVKDPKKSLHFYQETLGMKLLRTREFPAARFNLYFVGYENSKGINDVADTRGFDGLVELTWNYGTEDDEAFTHHSGNSDPQGFGHLCISVDDLDLACERFETLTTPFKKRLTDGRMKDVAFILDPDGYWIEVIQNEEYKKRVGW